jgi:hypothetical protein
MKAAWVDINFNTSPFKATYTLSGWDEINVTLDEHIVGT